MTPLTVPRIAFLVLFMAVFAVANNQPTHSYVKGTITGYDTRRAYQGTQTRAKVYELKGTDLVYQIDYCGAFQAGEFEAGQVVDYRVEGGRIYILHDNTKEYKCKIEGKKTLEGAKPDAPLAKP